MDLGTTKTVVEIFAYAAAGAFFLVKVLGVSFAANMEVDLQTRRKPDPARAGYDVLVVSVRLAKGEHGGLFLYEGGVRVVNPEGSTVVPLHGFNRVAWSAYTFDWSGTDPAPFSLTPGEKAVFECVTGVPSRSVCSCDVAILARRRFSPNTTQWRASCVSLPGDQPEVGPGGAAEFNKGMKLTSVEHIGRSQLIPGVSRTTEGRRADHVADRS